MIQIIVKKRNPVPISVEKNTGIQIHSYQRGRPGIGVPAGGTAGQVLKKIDGTDYNTEWKNEAGASPVVGLCEVAFGHPATGALTSSPYFTFTNNNYVSTPFISYGNSGGNAIVKSNNGTLLLFANTFYGNGIFIEDSGTVSIFTSYVTNPKVVVGTNYVRANSGNIATDLGFKLDQVGLRVGHYSNLSSGNTYQFEVQGGVGQMAKFGGIIMSDNYAGFADRNGIQVGGWWLHNAPGTEYMVANQTGYGQIQAAYQLYFSSPVSIFNSKVQIITSSDYEIEFSGTHHANIHYATPLRDLVFTLHSGAYFFSSDNGASYAMQLYSSLLLIAPPIRNTNLAGTGNRRTHVDASGNLLATEPAFDVVNEVPSGLINGSNATFTTAGNFVPGTEEVYLNGLKLVKLEDYNTTGTNQIDLYVSPGAGEHLIVNYKKI
ncbi:MAG: hypothetical protein JNK73_13135 [Bacteroidia bacterium]|nr:hypothetical protein [Bacteroidia bacterium]